jgi:hypothetical protein
MKTFGTMIVVLILGQVLSGCTIHHFVAEDYPKYLENNQGESKLPSAKNIETDYSITPATEKHSYEFRSGAAGYGNLWIVEFGKMLDQTLQSKDLQAAFGKLEKQSIGNKNGGSLIIFDLINYEFSTYAAHIELKITMTKNGTNVFEKTYKVDGNNVAGKMWTGGAFAMKNSVQQSTKLALDEILKGFINDLNNLPIKQ